MLSLKQKEVMDIFRFHDFFIAYCSVKISFTRDLVSS